MGYRKILLIGKTGQLGWELDRCLAPLGDVITLDYPDIDLSKPHTLSEAVITHQPYVIINAAAYTDVDRAEKEPHLARAVNAISPAALAEIAKRSGIALVHFSTDYVFDGSKGHAYTETDQPHPLNVYGETKLEGEQAIQQSNCAYWIFRTSWVYSLRKGGFVNKVLEWSRKNPSLRIVSDQIGNPTWCRMLAQATALALLQSKDFDGVKQTTGVYHLAGSGYCSRYDWAKSILALDPQKEEQVTTELLPACTTDFPTPAQRPLFSALDCNRFRTTFNFSLPEWPKALSLAMN